MPGRRQRKKRSDALPTWLRLQRVRASRDRWLMKVEKAGLCRRCGKARPVKGRTCDPCRLQHRKVQRRRYRRQKGAAVRQGMPSRKLVPALFVLAERPAWTVGEFAAARYPARADQVTKKRGAYGVAGKVLLHLLQLGLVAAVGVDRYRLTPHARRVMRDDVRKAA